MRQYFLANNVPRIIKATQNPVPDIVKNTLTRQKNPKVNLILKPLTTRKVNRVEKHVNIADVTGSGKNPGLRVDKRVSPIVAHVPHHTEGIFPICQSCIIRFIAIIPNETYASCRNKSLSFIEIIKMNRKKGRNHRIPTINCQISISGVIITANINMAVKIDNAIISFYDKRNGLEKHNKNDTKTIAGTNKFLIITKNNGV